MVLASCGALMVLLVLAFACVGEAAPPPPVEAKEYLRLSGEVEANLRQHILAKWFPKAVDRERGGFYQNFAEDWSRGENNDRGIVYQSRLTWVAAQAALRYPAEAETYRGHARHGLSFLADTLWDTEKGGGFLWSLTGTWAERGGEKHAYGVAFGIYASCAVYQATGDAAALDLARRAYAWLEKHAHDPKSGGYFEALTRDGKPILEPPSSSGRSTTQSDFIGTHYGYKSMNTHIHLLEAFTALYEIWPDPALRVRLQEVFHIVRDRIAVEPGCLNLYFTPAWRPIPDHDSFGHDVETAYLLVEAASALGMGGDAETWRVARSLVDHALAYGWDTESGGFYETGTAFGPPLDTSKIWWTQAEGLNALLLMHERFGPETPRYWEAFARQWAFIQKRQTDPRHGGWYPTVTRDGKPLPGQKKSDRWTEGYHQGRALLTVSAALRQLAGASVSHEKRDNP